MKLPPPTIILHMYSCSFLTARSQYSPRNVIVTETIDNLSLLKMCKQKENGNQPGRRRFHASITIEICIIIWKFQGVSFHSGTLAVKQRVEKEVKT